MLRRAWSEAGAIQLVTLTGCPIHRTGAQARHIKRQAEALCIRNQEVQRSCEELLDLVGGWGRLCVRSWVAGGAAQAAAQTRRVVRWRTTVERPLHLAMPQVATWPRENSADVRIPSDACNVFRDFCSRSMYQVGRDWRVAGGCMLAGRSGTCRA